ncbi:hypothetical protein [Streptomyces sp. NPDC000134]|uniref:hypothetical protein n=1 Tax=Streptomyces sp. NPDC000134 TaxID=3364536 RepID=UPI003689B069
MIVKMPPWLFHWVLLYLLFFSMLLWPVVFSWYGVRILQVARRIRSWTSQMKGQVVTATRRRLWRWLTESTADAPPEEEPSAPPLDPRPERTR